MLFLGQFKTLDINNDFETYIDSHGIYIRTNLGKTLLLDGSNQSEEWLLAKHHLLQECIRLGRRLSINFMIITGGKTLCEKYNGQLFINIQDILDTTSTRLEFKDIIKTPPTTNTTETHFVAKLKNEEILEK